MLLYTDTYPAGVLQHYAAIDGVMTISRPTIQVWLGVLRAFLARQAIENCTVDEAFARRA
jgi:hypothetical protein